MEAGLGPTRASFGLCLAFLLVGLLLISPIGAAGQETPAEVDGDPGPWGPLKGPDWAMELVGLRGDLRDLVRHWKERQLPSGRFSVSLGDSIDIPVASLPEWAAAFEPVAPWPSYLSITGDQEAFAALLGLCLAFGDQVLAPVPGLERMDFPEVLRGAAGTVVSYSYLLVPNSPAKEWLQAMKERWEFDSDDPLKTRIDLALLRQERDEEHADDLREALNELQSRKLPKKLGERLLWADLLLDVRLALGLQGNRALDQVREIVSDATERDIDDPREEQLLCEVLIRYRAVSRSTSLDEAITRWVEERSDEADLPLAAALIWSIEGGDDRLASALSLARQILERSRDGLRGEPASIWEGGRVACRDAFLVYSLVTQSGLGTRDGRIPYTVIRYRDARGVLGLPATAALWADVTAPGEAVVSLWQTALDQVTVWAEPAPEGSRLGRSWWEVRKEDDEGRETVRWSELPYFKIGRVGPLVLGPRKALRLKMTWVPGGSYVSQWSKPYEPVRIDGPPSAATR